MKRRPVTSILLIVIAGLTIGGVGYHKWKYPYGWSHCCIILMMDGLEQYAEEHNGHYPTGGSSPEASLSLLCQSNWIDAYMLRGMTVPEDTVRRALKHGSLGPDTCGWQYVDGLTRADDPGIAILYCKQPLGHNGERTDLR